MIDVGVYNEIKELMEKRRYIFSTRDTPELLKQDISRIIRKHVRDSEVYEDNTITKSINKTEFSDNMILSFIEMRTGIRIPKINIFRNIDFIIYRDDDVLYLKFIMVMQEEYLDKYQLPEEIKIF